MIEVSDVAAALIEHAGAISTYKLMKLTYYVQAWHAAIYGQPLFEARIEAWVNGPVSPVLWEQYKGNSIVREAVAGNPNSLTDENWDLIDLVISHYGHLNGDELSAITHSELPWLEARGDAPEFARLNTEISIESMAIFYADKTLAGHSPVELAIVGANPNVQDDEAASEILTNLLNKYKGTKVESTPIDEADYFRFKSGFDASNFEELSNQFNQTQHN